MRRELIVGGAIAAAAALGIGAEAISDPVDEPAAEPLARAYVERAVFCPPRVAAEGATSEIVVGSATGGGMPMALEVAPTDPDASPAPPETRDLGGKSVIAHKPEGGRAVNAVGYGAHPVAGAVATFDAPTEGSAGARCSERASDFWYFPVGSSALGFDERLLLYNPFSDEAVARITVFGPSGERSPAGLDDVPVPSHGWETVRLNEFLKTQDLTSAVVEVSRGRLIAWRVQFSRPEKGPRGAGMTLGATETSPTWYFPVGFVGEGADQSFTILNPSQEDATVNVSLISSDRVVVPQDLVGVPVPARTSQRISLDKVGAGDKDGLTHVTAVVTSGSDGTPIVVERTLAMDGDGFEGVAHEIGATSPGTRWALPPAAMGASSDALGVYNPSNLAATLRITLYAEGGERRLKALGSTRLRSGSRVTIPLADATDGPAFAVVESDRPVVAERVAYSSGASDIADVMGRSVLND